jgi:DNA-binding NtrC family response regulator
MKGKILIVEDNRSVLTALEMLLQTEFGEVFTLRKPEHLLTVLQEEEIDVVLLDMNFRAGVNTGNEGIFWLREILKYDPAISVIMITAYGDIELAVKAVKEGAFDFILKPWDNHKLLSTVQASLRLRKSRKESRSLKKTADMLKKELMPEASEIIGRSKKMSQVLEMVRKVAPTDANILITGENGTGKELIAQEIHRLSKRKREVLVSVDLGAVSETLFESELFGHVKGSFTDAHEDRTGKIETAHRGTLFLDEIGNLPLSLRAKMLGALQTRTITRVGSNTSVPVDIRLITATNKDLQALVAEGLFREDLLYRINTITIHLPPLREREEDILLLAEYFLKKYAAKYEKNGLKITRQAMERMLEYPWPGNVRELQHCMEKAVILAEEKVLDADHFALEGRSTGTMNVTAFHTLEEMEKAMIVAAIEKEKGNMSRVARKLGITRQTLYNKMKKYGL